jgi:hypothetical protein
VPVENCFSYADSSVYPGKEKNLLAETPANGSRVESRTSLVHNRNAEYSKAVFVISSPCETYTVLSSSSSMALRPVLGPRPPPPGLPSFPKKTDVSTTCEFQSHAQAPNGRVGCLSMSGTGGLTSSLCHQHSYSLLYGTEKEKILCEVVKVCQLLGSRSSEPFILCANGRTDSVQH